MVYPIQNRTNILNIKGESTNPDPRYPQTDIEIGAHISDGCNLGVGCQVGSLAWLEPNVVLGQYVHFLGDVHLGRNVIVGQNCTLNGSLQVEEGVRLAPGVQIAASPVTRTHIRKAVRMGINAHILGGISIGYNVFIHSNSHVIGDVPDFALVGGNPALLEDYVCPNCACRFSVVRNSPGTLVIYLKCRQCGQPEYGLTVANFQPRLSHVLLHGHTPGELVSLTGHDYRWLDDHEMIPVVQPSSGSSL